MLWQMNKASLPPFVQLRFSMGFEVTTAQLAKTLVCVGFVPIEEEETVSEETVSSLSDGMLTMMLDPNTVPYLAGTYAVSWSTCLAKHAENGDMAFYATIAKGKGFSDGEIAALAHSVISRDDTLRYTRSMLAGVDMDGVVDSLRSLEGSISSVNANDADSPVSDNIMDILSSREMMFVGAFAIVTALIAFLLGRFSSPTPAPVKKKRKSDRSDSD